MNISDSKFKTQPLAHQAYYLIHHAGKEFFANLCEQGTGKSWMFINEIAQIWEANKIDCVIILAPNGVHENWTRPNIGQIPQHMPDWVNYKSIAWTSSKTQWAIDSWENFIKDKTNCLKIYAFNWEVLQHDRSVKEFMRVVNKHQNIFIVLDESDAIKDPSSLRTKQIEKSKKIGNFKYRKISTGTPVNNSPFDVFSQFRFLDPNILGTDSYRAFQTEYAEILPPSHHLIKSIATKKIKLDPVQERDIINMFENLCVVINKNGREELMLIIQRASMAKDSGVEEMFVEILEELKQSFNPNIKSASKDYCLKCIDGIQGILKEKFDKIKLALNPNRIPIIIDKDKETGKKKYKNLDQLNALIAPHSYRVLRSECLDLPEKIYENLFFYLTSEQALVYKKLENEYRLEYQGKETPLSRLTIGTKLAQVTSGFYLFPGATEPIRIPGENPKLKLLLERIEYLTNRGKKAIIWARYTAEIEEISRELDKLGISNAKYYGKTKKKDRNKIIDEFENNNDELLLVNKELQIWSKTGIDVFISNAKAGGTGLTLVAASSVHYYSNTFSYRDRAQSEDRTMRIGQTENVTYYNYAGIGTIDEYIIECLINKQDVSFEIVDKGRELFSLGNSLLTS